MALNVGPSRGFNPGMIQRPAGPTQRPMGMARPRMMPPGGTQPPPISNPTPFIPPPEPQVPIDQGGVTMGTPPMGPSTPMPGPIDTGPTMPLPGMTSPMPSRPPGMIMDGAGVLPGGGLTGPDYTNPYQTQIPDMALTQNIGQNIRKTGGLRSAYGGSAAGLAGGPFRRQMFY